jgi:hypothetical protein
MRKLLLLISLSIATIQAMGADVDLAAAKATAQRFVINNGKLMTPH